MNDFCPLTLFLEAKMAILGIFCHRLDRVEKKCLKLESAEQSEALAFSLQRLLGNFSHL